MKALEVSAQMRRFHLVVFRQKLSGSFLTSWRTPAAIPEPIPAAMPVAEAPTASQVPAVSSSAPMKVVGWQLGVEIFRLLE